MTQLWDCSALAEGVGAGAFKVNNFVDVSGQQAGRVGAYSRADLYITL